MVLNERMNEYHELSSLASRLAEQRKWKERTIARAYGLLRTCV